MATQSPSIYLDNNATTRVDPEVRDAMLPYLDTEYANPSSPYRMGRSASAMIARTREHVADLLHASPESIFFTSGGTESNNTAMFAAISSQPERRHIVMTSVEHASVSAYGTHLEQRGYKVTQVGVDKDGRLDLTELDRALVEDTALVSVMTANNETGIIFPVETCVQMAHAKGALFHTDAIQAVGKIPVRAGECGVDFLSFSGHKFHAPKGIGGLYMRRDLDLPAYLLGGDQEFGRRAGTENVPGLAGLGRAAELAAVHMDQLNSQARDLRDSLEERLLAIVPDIHITGRRTSRLPNTSHVIFDGIEADALLALLDMEGISCSTGSACMSGAMEPSRVLEAMGFSPQEMQGSIRLSLCRFNSPSEIEYVIHHLPPLVARLRGDNA